MPQLSGQIAVTVAGDAEQGPDVAGTYFALKAHPANGGTVWIGNDGNDDVDGSTGFPLEPGEGIEVFARSLTELYFDADNSGDRVCWVRVE